MSIKQGLLALIHEKPRYGYELKTEFETTTGGMWKINVGQVYTTLDRLERDGLIQIAPADDIPADEPPTGDNGDEANQQKHYILTAAGREHLAAWFDELPTDQPLPRDDLLVKVMMAIEHGPRRGLEVITRQRTALFAILQQRRRDQQTPSSLAEQLMSDVQIVRTEADLRWLDQCENRLLTALRQPDATPQEINP